MAIRAIALSIALLIGLGTIIPLATEYAEAGGQKTRKYKKKERNWRGVKKYSKRWWQLYRAQERRKKQVAARKRALRLRQLRLEKARETELSQADASSADETAAMKDPAAVLPTGEKAPEGWKPEDAAKGEVQFRVSGDAGVDIGSASISVVGPATGETVTVGRQSRLGGVPTTSLRREVINKMIKENGWVVNDFQKEVGGKTVYVVVAQSQEKDGSIQSRMFYYTESGGRIYSVATNARADAAERLADESEKVIESIHGSSRPQQQAAVKAVIRERPTPTPLPPCTPVVE
jgi:hypothetical protein